MDDIRKKSFIAAAIQAVTGRFTGEKSCESENARDGAREACSFERDAMDTLVKLYTAIADVSDPDQAGMLVLQNKRMNGERGLSLSLFGKFINCI